MSQAEALYRLQTIDLQIEHATARLAEIQASLGESETLREARNTVAQAEARVAKLRKTLRARELDVQSQRAKLQAEEQKLYGGKIRNPKELAGLQEEVTYLQRQLEQMEDEVLNLMLELDTAEAELAKAQEQLHDIEVTWGDQQTALRQEAADLQAQLAALQQEREDVCLYIVESNLAVYEKLRRQKGGRAVALVSGGLCQGCQVTLPTSELQQLRRSSSLTFCSNCGRILHLQE